MGKGSNNDIIGTFALSATVDQFYFEVTSNLKMSQQGKCSNEDTILIITL